MTNGNEIALGPTSAAEALREVCCLKDALLMKRGGEEEREEDWNFSNAKPDFDMWDLA